MKDKVALLFARQEHHPPGSPAGFVDAVTSIERVLAPVPAPPDLILTLRLAEGSSA